VVLHRANRSGKRWLPCLSCGGGEDFRRGDGKRWVLKFNVVGRGECAGRVDRVVRQRVSVVEGEDALVRWDVRC